MSPRNQIPTTYRTGLTTVCNLKLLKALPFSYHAAYQLKYSFGSYLIKSFSLFFKDLINFFEYYLVYNYYKSHLDLFTQYCRLRQQGVSDRMEKRKLRDR